MPVFIVVSSASLFMYATMRIWPVSESCAIAVIRPAESKRGVKSRPSSIFLSAVTFINPLFSCIAKRGSSAFPQNDIRDCRVGLRPPRNDI